LLKGFSKEAMNGITGKKPQPRVTLRSLSQELGVSPATVSVVLRGEGNRMRISAKTQDRIHRLAAERHYRPSSVAQALRSQRTRTVGVVFPDVQETFMNRVLKGIETELHPADYRLMISTSYFNGETEAKNVRNLLDHEVDGLLIVPYAPFRGEAHVFDHLAEIVERDVPAVAIDRYVPGVLDAAVVADDFTAARRGVEALIAGGCGSVGYVGFDLEITSLAERYRGYQTALETAELDGETILLTERNPAAGDLHSRLARQSADGAMPDGFLVSSNGLSYRMWRILDALGEKRTKLAKFGEDPHWAETGMIQIRQPHEELGQRAARRICTMIADGITTGEREVLSAEWASDKEDGI
jgi:LacI family transcriptional regulator